MALIYSKMKIDITNFAYANKLDFQVRETNIETQKME